MNERLKTHSKTQKKSADLVSNKLRIGVFQLYQMKCKSVSKKSPRYNAPLDVHVSVDRVNGYKQSLAAHNIAVRDEWIVDGGYTHETALQAARELLSQSPLPEAVFATDSLKLMSIYRAAAEKNIAIPQQLAVVGYSNETLSFILTPAPGGIDIPTQELGQQSCELLFRLISGKPSPQNITVATHMTLK